MYLRFLSLLVISAALTSEGQTVPTSSIRFEDSTASAGIQFTHSFGAQKLGSLLESTGSGCVWFDYNNDGFPDLYVATGKPLASDTIAWKLSDGRTKYWLESEDRRQVAVEGPP